MDLLSISMGINNPLIFVLEIFFSNLKKYLNFTKNEIKMILIIANYEH
jgi:hypothetical protein